VTGGSISAGLKAGIFIALEQRELGLDCSAEQAKDASLAEQTSNTTTNKLQ
jgi:hypothetical protein